MLIFIRSVVFLSLCLLGLLVSSQSYAWGALGHQSICDIAWRSSSQPIRRRLSAAAKGLGFKTFAHSCTWADRIKRDKRYDYLKPMHYINVDRSARQVTHSRCLSESRPLSSTFGKTPDCVVTAVDYYQQLLASASKKSAKQYAETVLLLAHLVGDLHQPLHVSYAQDRGGNQRRVLFGGKVLSLHQLWDSEILYCRFSEPNRGTSWRQLGAYLHRHSQTPDQPLNSTAQELAIDWANESLALTRTIYENLPKSTRKPIDVEDYCQAFYPVALARLSLAGRRLATLLAETLVP